MGNFTSRTLSACCLVFTGLVSLGGHNGQEEGQEPPGGSELGGEIRRDSSDRTELLLDRIDRYYQLFKERKYEEAYYMEGSKWREGEDERDRRDWVRGVKKIARGIRDVDWRATRIWLAGDLAKVRMKTTVRWREGRFKWEEGEAEEDEFWVFENENWYYIPIKLRDWNESKAVEVPVPRSPRSVEIKVKG